MILRIFKFFLTYGFKFHPVSGFQIKDLFPIQVKKLDRGPSDQLPTPGAVKGIDPGLLVGNTDRTGRDEFPGDFFPRREQPGVKSPHVREARGKPDHVNVIKGLGMDIDDLLLRLNEERRPPP